MKDVIHMCPPHGQALTPCCGRTQFELLCAGGATWTCDPALVTCGKPEHSRLPFRAECFTVYNADGEQIALTGGLPAHRARESEANAKLLALGATHHAQLIAVLRGVQGECASYRSAVDKYVGSGEKYAKLADVFTGLGFLMTSIESVIKESEGA
jgi:hypothetical protein